MVTKLVSKLDSKLVSKLDSKLVSKINDHDFSHLKLLVSKLVSN